MNAPPTDKKYERVIKMSSNCYVSVKVANGVFVFSERQKDPGEQFQINDLFERYWWAKFVDHMNEFFDSELSGIMIRS